MLFTYKHSKKRLLGLGFSVLLNLTFFVAFQFYFNSLPGISILFLASLIMNSSLFILEFLKGARYTFYENQIKIESRNESKTLVPLNLLFIQSFKESRSTHEKLHLVTSEGEYTFTDEGNENYMLLKDYLYERVQESDVAKYHYHLKQIREKVPSMLLSLGFLICYIYYFNSFDIDSIFFKLILGLQTISLLVFGGQWLYYSNKIKKTSIASS